MKIIDYIHIWDPEKWDDIKIEKSNRDSIYQAAKMHTAIKPTILPAPYTNMPEYASVRVFHIEVGANKTLKFEYAYTDEAKKYKSSPEYDALSEREKENYEARWGWGELLNNSIQWYGWFWGHNRPTKNIAALGIGTSYNSENQQVRIVLDNAFYVDKKLWMECFINEPNGTEKAGRQGIIISPYIKQSTITKLIVAPKDAGEDKVTPTNNPQNEEFVRMVDQQNKLNNIEYNGITFKYGENVSVMLESCIMDTAYQGQHMIHVSLFECTDDLTILK